MSTVPEKLNKIKYSASSYNLFNCYTHTHKAQFIVLPQIIRNLNNWYHESVLKSNGYLHKFKTARAETKR
jgi:hypothetical protein